METPAGLEGGPTPVAASGQPHVSIMRRLKSLSLKKLFLAFVGIGAGFGVALVATFGSIAWFASRPIPARDWPRLNVEGAGLKAKLRTDWNDSVRYQLVVTPRSDDLKAVFDDAVRSHRDSISFTLHLYDKAGFELCKKDVKPTPFVDAGPQRSPKTGQWLSLENRPTQIASGTLTPTAACSLCGHEQCLEQREETASFSTRTAGLVAAEDPAGYAHPS